MSDEKKGGIGLGVIALIVLTMIGCFSQKEDPDNKWGSKYGNENIRKTIRDEMIKGGTDPTIAEIYTKQQYEQERQKHERNR
jgi:hypothetical protein